jgi:hypothetical protein
MKNSPSGSRILSNGLTILKQTDHIPGKLGVNFGTLYIMKANVTKNIPVEEVWIFPSSMKDDNGKEFRMLRYTIEKPTNQETYSTYSFEQKYEIVKGKWIYQMFYHGVKIFERKFYVE